MQADPLHGSLVPTITITNKTLEDAAGAGSSPSATRLFSRSRATAVPATPDYGYYILQFTGPIQPGWKEAVQDIGGKFFDYIPQYAFIVRLPIAQTDTASALEFVRWMGEYAADLKLSNGVLDVTPETLDENSGYLDVRLIAFAGEDASVLQAAVYSAGGSVLSTSSSEWGVRLSVRIPITKVTRLKDIKGVKWIEKAPKHELNDSVANAIMQTSSVQGRPYAVSGTRLYGEGQTVAIADTGLDTGVIGTVHTDFSDGAGGTRVTGLVAQGSALAKDDAGHGTHVAGLVAGNGMNSGSSPATNDFPASSHTGVAPKANIYFQATGNHGSLVGLPADLTNLFQPAYDADARIHTNSWGSAGLGDYSSECTTVDQFIWDHKDFLILYAAGNAGRDKDMNGVVDPYSLDTPSTAKNCLAVGASESYRTEAGEGFATDGWGTFRTYAEPIASDTTSDNPHGLAAFSSHGPTIDGRYKPEVVAPGTNILSTRSSITQSNGWGTYNQYYCWMGGTSMATPQVAGTAALLREYLMKEKGFAAPSAALVKTGLIHAATSIAPGQFGTGAAQETSAPPDFAQGWGRVNLKNALDSGTIRRTDYYDITSSAPTDTSYSRTFTLNVANDDTPFRATLGWSDYPGSSAAGGGLANDLDLRVQKPDGTWVYPDNAMNLSTLTKFQYVSTVTDFYKEPATGLRITPSSYPATLESVALAFSNPNSIMESVDIVVYRYANGAVGEELFRKSFAFFPSGEHALPVGLTIANGEIMVAVEKQGSASGVYYHNSNPSTRGMVRVGGVWQQATLTPGLIVNFRAAVAATQYDRVNNTVSVTIDAPEPGTYTAQVTAHNIAVGPQPYALVMSGMTGTVTTNADPEINVEQPNAPAATLLRASHTPRERQVVNNENGTNFIQIFGDQVAFSVQASADAVVSMRYAVSGLPEMEAQHLTLTKLLGNGNNISFHYPKLESYDDGNWWLTDATGMFVDPDEVLDTDRTYYVVSVLKDNGAYDGNADSGVIEDPQILGMTPQSLIAGGCTIGTGDDYTIALLLGFALFAFAVRRAMRGRI